MYVFDQLRIGKNEASEQFQKLIRTLAELNLETEVRAGDDTSIFVFVKAGNDHRFADLVYRSRIRDWLHGVRQIQPVKETVHTLTEMPLSQAERLRIIYALMTAQQIDGGANITPKHGEWKNVEAIFPLHDHERNKRWLAEFAKKTFLTPEDLDHIRDAVGEKVSTTAASSRKALTYSDCILLRLPTVLFQVPHLSCRLRCFRLAPAWELLSRVYDRYLSMVGGLCRVLETTRARVISAMGCQECWLARVKEKRVQTTESPQRSSHWRRDGSFPRQGETEEAAAASPLGNSLGNCLRSRHLYLLLHRDFHL